MSGAVLAAGAARSGVRGLYPGSVTWGKAFPTLDGWAAVHVPEDLSRLDWSPSQGLITRVRARIRGAEHFHALCRPVEFLQLHGAVSPVSHVTLEERSGGTCPRACSWKGTGWSLSQAGWGGWGSLMGACGAGSLGLWDRSPSSHGKPPWRSVWWCLAAVLEQSSPHGRGQE